MPPVSSDLQVDSGNWPGWRGVAFYAVLALIPQLVLWLHPSAFPFIDPGGDIATTMWNHWWVDTALRSFSNPYQCPVLFRPFGAPLYMTTVELVDILVTWPARALGGVIVAYKAALFLNTLWTSIAAHALARRLGVERLGAFVVGVVMAHCSYRFANVQAISLLATGHPLFLLWAFAGCVREPGRVGHAVLLGFAALFCVFSNLYYLLFMTLLIPAAGIAAFFAGWRPGRAWLVPFAKSMAIAFGVSIGPVAWFYTNALDAQNHLGMVREYALSTKTRGSADLLQLLLPAWLRALATGEPVPDEAFRLMTLPLRAYSYAPPLVFVVGAVAGWWASRRKAERPSGLPRCLRAALVGAALTGALVALGPQAKLWTRVDPADVVNSGLTVPPEWRGVSVPSPVQLLQHLPLWNNIRATGRAGYFVLLAAMLLGAGPFVHAVRAAQQRFSPALAKMLPLIAVLAVCGEESHGVYTIEPIGVHPVYLELRDHPGTGAVREFPDIGYYQNGMMMFAQTVHHKPLAAGYLARDLPEYDRWIDSRPWVQRMREVLRGKARRLSPEECAEFLRTAAADGVQFLVWNADQAVWTKPETLRSFMVENRLGEPLGLSDESKMVFVLATGS